MHELAGGRMFHAFRGIPAGVLRARRGKPDRVAVRMLLVMCLIVLAAAAISAGRSTYDDEGYDSIDRRGLEQIDRINEALEQAGRIFLWVGAVAAVLIVLKMAGPFRHYTGVKERLLDRAVRDVDELLKRIEKEAETTNTSPQEETAEEGLLAGMAEVAEFEQAEHVPSYVLTVNDLMLDNVGITLRRLRKFKEGNAPRYRDYMFSVLRGIKTITEQSAEAGIDSGLAVNVKEYFGDDRRYKAWRKLLPRAARSAKNRDIADAFLLFVRDVRQGRPLAAAQRSTASAEQPTVGPSEQAAAIPDRLNEETLPMIQQAAEREARNLCTMVLTGKPADGEGGWQVEFVRRQQQVHLRDEAQKMLSVFLSGERKMLHRITKIRMLPCRTWGHVLHMLGVESSAQLHRRLDDRLLTIQEIIILEKAFLQTFAKRSSLERVYGKGDKAALMIDAHVPEIRREALKLLRRSHRTEPKRFNRATEALNDEETPQNDTVKKLIARYICHDSDPPDPGPGAT